MEIPKELLAQYGQLQLEREACIERLRTIEQDMLKVKKEMVESQKDADTQS